MKKIITFMALLTFTAGAWADDETNTTSSALIEDVKTGSTVTNELDTIGKSDYSIGWWDISSGMSNAYLIPKGYTLTLSYKTQRNSSNYSSLNSSNSYNYSTALMVTNDCPLNNREDSTYQYTYKEYIGLTDAGYTWDNLPDTGNHFAAGFPDSDSVIAEALDGATIKVKVAHEGDSIYVTMEEASSDGNTLITQYAFNNVDTASATHSDTLRAFIVVSYCYVSNLTSTLSESIDTSIDDGYPYPYISNGGEEVDSVGSSNYSTTWWSAFSSYYRIPEGYTLTLNYTGHNNNAPSSGNWNTYIYVTNDMTRYQLQPGYNEYAGVGVADTISTGMVEAISQDYFSTGYSSNSTEIAKALNGANIEVKIANNTYDVIITTTAISASGDTIMNQRAYDYSLTDGETVRAFLVVEENYLTDITSILTEGIDTEISAGNYPYIGNGGEEEDSVGNSDLSTIWWGDFSSYYLVPSGYQLDLSFTNYCDTTTAAGNDNSSYTSNVTALMVTSDVNQEHRSDVDDNNTTYYKEFVGVVDGGYEWCNYNNRTYSSDFTYENKTELAKALYGATINATVKNLGGTLSVEMVAIPSTKNDTMTQTVSLSIDDQILRSFLVVDSSYVSDLTSTLTPIYERANTSDGAYGTICLPYAATAEGATIYHVVGYGATTTTSEDGTTTETPSELYLEEVTAMEAGKGYVFCASDTSAITFTMSGTKVSEAVGDTLVGNLSTASLAVPDTCYILTSKESDGTTTYYWGKGKSNTVAQYRAYLDLGVFTETSNETTAAKKGWLRMSLETDGDDGTTGIKEIATEEQSRYDDDAFYNLSGVRVTNPQKGIYIRNGKKYIFK